MRIKFHILGFKENAGFRNWLRQSLERLGAHVPISAAAVVLEHQRNNTPAFRAYALLAVPGPDIHAQARDHTLDAAWLKVTTALRKQIDQRKCRQDSRMKSNGHVRAQPARRNAGAIGRFRN